MALYERELNRVFDAKSEVKTMVSRMLVRTPTELRAARHALGLSAEGLARMVRVESGRTVRRWESGEREIPGPVAALIETALSIIKQKHVILKALEQLESGQLASRSGGHGGMIDNTGESILVLSNVKTSLEKSFAALTMNIPNFQSETTDHPL